MGIFREEDEGLVFNIQRYSIHDGPGIRTIVFLKGCPLRCPWCANPEGLDVRPVLSYNAVLCTKCRRCAGVCPKGAISFWEEGGLSIGRDRCGLCGACAASCPSGALRIFGGRMTVRQVLEEVQKDAAFYRRSGGGLTLSGGEPLSSPGFSLALLKRAQEEYAFDTAVETSFFAPPQTAEALFPYVRHILADIKLMDSRRHRECTGVDNALILENIRRAAFSGASLIIRFPFIPGINDDEENLNAMAEFLAGLERPVPLEILPYHEFGRGKFESLGLCYPLADRKIAAPGKEEIDRAEDFLRRKGVRVIHT
jgi:pyruvate formate lyase activating enzyme